jgi:hypothetical protein
MTIRWILATGVAVCLLMMPVHAQRGVPTIPKIPTVPYLPPPPPPRPTPLPTPLPTVPVVRPVPPPPPVAAPTVVPVVPCDVTSLDALGNSTCGRRYITSTALRRDLQTCRGNGYCYARKLLRLHRSPTPVVVQYPQAYAELAAARVEIKAELAIAARTIASAVETKIANGEPNLPSLQGLGNLVDAAMSAIDAIEVPLESGVDESMRRLAALLAS